MQKTLIFIGIAFLAIGLLWPTLSRIPLGRFPGDIIITRPHFKIYIPITTMVLISLILSVLARIFRK
ncbi:MAG: DUF2905 domain-containing protein [Proteobacteria bacterium]|nr:DUF2905 domain-containing protein [Pseudomonadota bacterium]MBU1708398.1 DUF2905 domain-containing protein [Pseudomonadota bacterium]